MPIVRTRGNSARIRTEACLGFPNPVKNAANWKSRADMNHLANRLNMQFQTKPAKSRHIDFPLRLWQQNGARKNLAWSVVLKMGSMWEAYCFRKGTMKRSKTSCAPCMATNGAVIFHKYCATACRGKKLAATVAYLGLRQHQPEDEQALDLIVERDPTAQVPLS